MKQLPFISSRYHTRFLKDYGRLEMLLLIMGLVLVLVTANMVIWQKESLLQEGKTILLPLRPRDPRSLLQGDYMRLRFSLSADIEQHYRNKPSMASDNGYVVVQIDENNVAKFHSVNQSSESNNQYTHLKFRKRGNNYRIASNAYFFQEGSGEHYSKARFAELKVDPAGNALITGLRDSERTEISPQ